MVLDGEVVLFHQRPSSPRFELQRVRRGHFLRLLSLENSNHAVLAPPLNFRVTCELDYTLQDPATFLFAIQCLKAGGQQILGESLVTDPGLPVEEFCGGFVPVTRESLTARGEAIALD